jgi:ubiquinone/menaquinone biosynthesis C-methylase UbiE
MQTFKDNFSRLSEVYVKYRPSAPAELFSYLQTLTSGHQLALDCGTGNGQAAVPLAEYFEKVVATDPSAEQIRLAAPHQRVEYRVERAENPVLQESSADIVTVSQALHWFDFGVFFAEVKRVLKPGGIFAAWAYPLPEIEPELDKAIRYFHEEVVGPFWQYENRMIDKAYANIPFPFPLIETPEFHIRKEFSFEELIGLLYTWSAVLKYREQHGTDPVEAFRPELETRWGDAEKRTVTWTLILKIGRNEK